MKRIIRYIIAYITFGVLGMLLMFALHLPKMAGWQTFGIVFGLLMINDICESIKP